MVDEPRLTLLPVGLLDRNRSDSSQTAASDGAAVVFLGSRVAATLAGKRIVVESDDASLLPTLFVVFGGDDRRDEPPFFHVTYRNRLLEVRRDGELLATNRLFFGLDEPDCPYRLDGSVISFRDDGSAQFTLLDTAVRVHETPRWREAVASLLPRVFQSLLDDLVLMHAAAAGIGGRGLLLIGYQKAGKSTVALTLAARGHDFLSDEIGCYDPRTHELVPYRRPVGIRPGPRSAAIERALSLRRHRVLQHEESARVDLATLIPLAPERRLPLHAVVFLDGFAESPAIRYADPGRNEVGMLQTLYSSFTNAPHAQRTFELVRLLSRCRVAYLKIGDPDETAALLEEEFGSWAE